MLRLLSVLCIALVMGMATVKDVSAVVADSGPPYTSEQFLALAPDILPNGFRRILPDWWPRAPAYLRTRILGARSDMWWPIIQCNFMGFKPEGMAPGGADKCEKDQYQATQRGRNSWSADGQWVGPSDECRKRGKRSQWGELICD